MLTLNDNDIDVLKMELHQLIQLLDQLDTESRSLNEQISFVRNRVQKLEQVATKQQETPVRYGLEWETKDDKFNH